MKNRYWKLLLLLVIFSGLFLRLWQINSFPPLNRDEAAIGYNAYSILKTGRDEWGEFLPLPFKSFGDYKMPGYIYLTILPVKFFGLNKFSVRFWSGVSGVIAVIVFYFLTKWICEQLQFKKIKSKYLAVVAVLILIFNPWHVYFSRMGFEANLALTCFLGALTIFLYGLKRRWLLPIAALGFVSNLYIYSSGFIFLPFFLSVLGLLFIKDLFRKVDKWLIIAGLILLVGCVHASWSVWQVSLAKTNITIFSDPGISDEFNHLRFEVFQESPLWARFWLNKPFYYGRLFLKNYLKSFSPKFLIISAGSHPWHQIPGMGHFYWTDILFMIIGLVAFWRLKIKRVKYLLGSWLLLAPLPSAITVDAPHATRMLQIMPVIIITMVLGIGFLWNFLNSQKQKIRSGAIWIFIICYWLQISGFGYLYLVNYSQNLPKSLLPGIDQAIYWITKQKEQRKIIFSNPLDFPYIYVAFYEKLDPKLVQERAIWKPPDLAKMTAIESVGEYRFWEGIHDPGEKAFYVLQGEARAPDGFSLTKEFKQGENVWWRIYVN